MIFPLRYSPAFSTGPGPVTRECLRARTRELAVRAGRMPPHVTQVDNEEARREITGESERDRQEAALASLSDVEPALARVA
jgi:hypothetical protein